jgi:hypothetical protein
MRKKGLDLHKRWHPDGNSHRRFAAAPTEVTCLLSPISGIRVHATASAGRHEVIVFVNNEQGQSEEAFKIYLTFHSEHGDMSWA